MLKSTKKADKKYKCIEDFPLGSYIKKTSVQKSITNTELQRLTGATEYTMTRFLQNKMDIDAKKFIMLCDILDIDATTLSNSILYNGKEQNKSDQKINYIVKNMTAEKKNDIIKHILKAFNEVK